jgi:hypothetical protein
MLDNPRERCYFYGNACTQGDRFMGNTLATMILGGLTPQEALDRNRLDLLARLRGDVVADIVTHRSSSGYFLSAEDQEAARKPASTTSTGQAAAAS